MSRLTTNADVRERRSTLKNVTEVNDAIDDALEGTTLYLEGAIGTVFLRATLKDTFYVDVVTHPMQGQFSFMKLTQGFLDSGTAPVVRLASLFTDLSIAAPLTVDKDYTVKGEQGLIALHNSSISDSDVAIFERTKAFGDRFYVQVDYDAGFTVQNELFESVPDWLKEAAVAYSIVILNTQSPIKPMAKMDEVSKELLRHVRVVVDQKRRSFGSAIRPVV